LSKNSVQIPFDMSLILSRNRLLSLWRLMAGFRIPYLIATVGVSLAALSKTTTYLLLRYFVDQVLGEGKFPSFVTSVRSGMIVVALGFVFLALLEGSMSFLSGRMTAFTAEGIARRLRNFLFDHIQRLTFAYHDKTQTGELIQRSTSDVDAIRRFFADQAIGVGRVFLLFFINFFAIWQLNSTLALISVVVVPFIVLVSIFFFKRVTEAYEKYQDQEAKLSTTLQENLTGVRVVKAFAKQTYEKDKFNVDNLEKYARGKRLLLMHSMFWPMSDILCGAQLLTGMVFGAWMAIQARISLGDYLAYMGLVGWLIWPMRNLGRLIVQTSTGLVSFNRVAEIVREQRESLDEGASKPHSSIFGAIEFDQVSFQYEEGIPTLSNVSFKCKPGQVVALLGPTGSGKSSLVNLLPRFYDYTSGSIRLDGKELNSYSREFLRNIIGIVEQEPFLFSRSIRENIIYGVNRDVSQSEIEAATRAAAIHDVIIGFPDGYNTLVGEKGVTLSGGQKQRVAIARTLLKNPRILILDDSTSSVDTETEGLIRGALTNLMANRTTFIIAHRIQSVMDADLILVMEKGYVVQYGRHQDLMIQDGIYRKIYEIQTQIEVELEKEIASSAAQLL
jgi:ATP-binding cassette, subfamily B, bacterial